MLLLVLFVAAFLRFWQLGEIPPGFYRDEAFNGLDAATVLAGEQEGKNPFYFEANNGREPVYIYLTTLAVAVLGRTVTAVRVSAAAIGTLTTLLVYLLAKSWFNNRVGLLASFLWAVTVWPIHLSRVGLRPILLPLMLALVFVLGTVAYRRSVPGKSAVGWWLLAGLVYGLAFYTYLAVRFTPILLFFLFVYLLVTGRRQRVFPGVGWFVLGTAVTSLPLLILFWQQPEILLGRAGQVSILNPEISGGVNPLLVLWRQGWQALGLFFVKGDTILRHNPPGRPVFDLFMAGPFLVGVLWCVRHWRRPAAATLLLWSLVMLGPTILAEDAPHFLRAVGLLPAILIFPAVGLDQLWNWVSVTPIIRPVLVAGLLLGSLVLTVKDYFFDYANQPETAYWFEAAARDLAANINSYEVSPADDYLDQRFWDGWPAVRFLVHPDRQPIFYRPEEVTPNQFERSAVVYAWPYEKLEQVLSGFGSGLVNTSYGELAQGDLEAVPYPFYSRYTLEPAPDWPVLAKFDISIQLRQANVIKSDYQQGLIVDLYWSTTEIVDTPLIVFVHLVGTNGIIAQSDTIPGQGTWPTEWWRPGIILHDQHIIDLADGTDPGQYQIVVGFYQADTKARLAVYDADGMPVGDTWLLQP
ncbi:MAG: glycosyltransferase family 39 protein [Candidatus Promineifilaceae bacterium]